MAEKPIFPDCAYPDDCRCAARGYEHERDGCAVPGVAASAAMFGIDPAKLFGGQDPPATASAAPGAENPTRGPGGSSFLRHGLLPRPEVVVFRDSTVVRLAATPGDNLSLARALRTAIGAIGYETVFGVPVPDVAAVARLQESWSIGRGLREEAGVGNSESEILASRSMRNKAGARVFLWLVLLGARHTRGATDCLVWQVAVQDGPGALWYGGRDAAETAFASLVRAGGGRADDDKDVDHPIACPTEAEIVEMRKL